MKEIFFYSKLIVMTPDLYMHLIFFFLIVNWCLFYRDVIFNTLA